MTILDTVLFSGIALLFGMKLALLAVAAMLAVRGVSGNLGRHQAARVTVRARRPSAGLHS